MLLVIVGLLLVTIAAFFAYMNMCPEHASAFITRALALLNIRPIGGGRRGRGGQGEGEGQGEEEEDGDDDEEEEEDEPISDPAIAGPLRRAHLHLAGSWFTN